MRANQFINEIRRLADIVPGDTIDINRYDSVDEIKSDSKKLPGNNPYRYTVIAGLGSYNIYIIDPAHDVIIGKLILDQLLSKFPLKRAVSVDYITVHRNYTRYGIAKSMYGIALSILKLPLVAGDSQTPGGRRNWVSLNKIPGVIVKGYISIDDRVFDSYHADVVYYQDAIMSTGAQYMGEDRRGHHYFAFDIKSNDGAQELQAVYGQFMRLYDEQDPYIATGLYAVWTGK